MKNHNHIIRKATVDDIDVIMSIMDEVAHPLFIKDDREYVLRHIENEGFVIVVQSEDIDAYLMIHYCDYDEDVNLHHIAYMDSVGVRVKARGKGLMKLLIQYAEELLEEEYSYYMATVHPDNQYSLNVFLELGYEISQIVYRYNNNKRYLMLKNKSAYY